MAASRKIWWTPCGNCLTDRPGSKCEALLWGVPKINRKGWWWGWGDTKLPFEKMEWCHKKFHRLLRPDKIALTLPNIAKATVK